MEKAPKVLTKRVICLNCQEEVEVVLVPYGDGHIGTCPKCKKLAYNGK